MDISLGKQGANWHSQEVAQVLHGLLESVWWGIFGIPSSLSGKGQVGPPRIAQVGVLREGRREVFTQRPLLSLRMGLKSLSPLF